MTRSVGHSPANKQLLDMTVAPRVADDTLSVPVWRFTRSTFLLADVHFSDPSFVF